MNGSQKTANTTPDPNFTFTIGKKGAEAVNATQYFKIEEPKLEKWNFTWYEGKATWTAPSSSTVIGSH